MDFPPIKEKWLALKQSKIKQSPSNNLRASSVGHACERHLYHSIKDWAQQELHDPILQSIFDEGNLHEDSAMEELRKMGFAIVENQRAFQIESPLITGRIDGILEWQGYRFPFDVKSISPYDFDKMQSVEDFWLSKKVHQKNYVTQLQLYLFMSGNEYGFLLLKNKLTGEIKPIWMQLDYILLDDLLKKAQRVYKHIEANDPPKRINDLDVCLNCRFRHICLPDIAMGEGVQIIDDFELVSMIERRAQLQESAKEFKEVDEKIKDMVSDHPGEKVAGDWLIRVTEHTRKGYTVADSAYNMTKFVNLKDIGNKKKKTGATI